MPWFNRRRREPSREYISENPSAMLPRWTHPPERNAYDWMKTFSKSPRLAVVEKIASDLSFATGKLYVIDDNGEERELEKHSFLDFWENPNPLYEFSAASIWRLQEIYLLLKGEGYFVMERDAAGRPAELWPVPTHWVQMTPYLGHPYYTVRTTSGNIMDISVDDMFVMKDLNPLDPFLRGLGQAESVADEVEIDEYAAKFQKRFFYNDATPDLIISMPGATEQQRSRFRAEWLEKFKGVFKSHGVATLAGNISVQKVSENMKDMDMIQGRAYLRDAVLEHFGVPREIMGITESSNRATSEAAQYIYAQNVLTPRLKRREYAINQQLLPQFGENLVWRYDDIIPKNQEFDKAVGLDGWNAGILTKDEAREKLGMPPAPDGTGKVYKITFSDLYLHEGEDPASVSGSMMTMQYGTPADSTGQDPQSGQSEDGSAAAVAHAPVEAPAEGSDLVEVTGLGGKAKKSISLRRLVLSEDAAARQSIGAFEIATMKYFREQARRIGAALGETEKADSTAWDALKQYITQTGRVDKEAWDKLTPEQQQRLMDEFTGRLIDWPGEEEALSRIFMPLWKQAYDAGAKLAQDTYGLRAVQRPELISHAKLRGGQRVVGITETTKNDIAHVVAAGIENGDSTKTISENILKVMNTNERRARLIANQETMTSLSTGQYDMMGKAGARTKTWHHMTVTPDFRDWHKDMEGETVPFNAKFSNGLRYPRDPEGPARETINCRCVCTPNF